MVTKQSERGEGVDAHTAAMYALLCSANDAVLSAKTSTELYQGICAALTREVLFPASAVIVCDTNTHTGQIVATASRAPQLSQNLALSVDKPLPQELGLFSPLYRLSEPVIINDLTQDPRMACWHAPARTEGIGSAAFIPFDRDGSPGMLLVLATRGHDFDAACVELLRRLAKNLTFGLVKLTNDARGAVGSQYKAIFDSIEDAYYEVDLQGNPRVLNGATARMLGIEQHELLRLNNRAYQTPEMAAAAYALFNEVYRTGRSEPRQYWECVHRDGQTIRMEGSIHLVRNAKGEPVGFRGFVRDITARREIEEALQQSEARFRALTNLSSDWYWETDPQLRITRLESRNTTIDAARAALLGMRAADKNFETRTPGGWDAYHEAIASGNAFRDVILYRLGRDGTPYYSSVSGEPIFNANGELSGYRGVAREITAQKVAEERAQYLATHDALSGLPNRVMFSHLLNIAIPAARRHKSSLGILLVDLDRFKLINDTLGHEAGDALLKQVADRFKQTLRESDVIARLGGDEFTVLIEDLKDATQAAAVARKLLSAISQPFEVMGRECRMTASIGIATFPSDGDDEQSLMKHADIAMYSAKEKGKNNFQFCSQEIEAKSRAQLAMETNLRRAIERKEFFLHYQAKRDIKRNVITGVEALLRWNNDELGNVSPAEFIPVAEETGLIVEIGKWVLRTACAQNIAWQRQGLPPICMAVNLSVRQFADPGLLHDIATVLQETGMKPNLLELEITEGMVVQHPAQAARLLADIKQMGVRLAIDDFGTGYSSLGQLKNFPIDTLKVDRSFIRDVASEPSDQAITEAIIAMGKALSLTVVAEGVETVEQEDFLRKHACDEMQGFYFSRPVSPDALAALLRSHSESTAQ